MKIYTKEINSCLHLKHPLGSKVTMLIISREKNSKGNLTSDFVVRIKVERVFQVKNITWP